MSKKTCAQCKMRKRIVWNLFKKDIQRPRIYIVHCGLSFSKDDDASNCEYFVKK